MNTKVSVIVPVHNTEIRIRKCIESLVDQKLKDIEVLLVDDGSSDRSGAICDEYAASHSLIKSYHKVNGGASSARNYGLRLAKGEYIAFVDSDDYIESDMISVMYDIAKSKNVDIVNCGHYYETTNGSKEKHCTNFNKNKVIKQNETISLIISSANNLTPFCYVVRNLYKRELLIDNNIRFDENIKYGEDTTFNLYSFYHAESMYSIDRYLYHYVRNDRSQIRALYKDDYLIHLSRTYESWCNFYNYAGLNNIKLMQDLHENVINSFLIELIINAWRSSKNDFKGQIVFIRNSNLIAESFLDYKLNINLGLFSKIIIILMRERMYSFVSFLFFVRFLGKR